MRRHMEAVGEQRHGIEHDTGDDLADHHGQRQEHNPEHTAGVAVMVATEKDVIVSHPASVRLLHCLASFSVATDGFHQFVRRRRPRGIVDAGTGDMLAEMPLDQLIHQPQHQSRAHRPPDARRRRTPPRPPALFRMAVNCPAIRRTRASKGFLFVLVCMIGYPPILYEWKPLARPEFADAPWRRWRLFRP